MSLYVFYWKPKKRRATAATSGKKSHTQKKKKKLQNDAPKACNRQTRHACVLKRFALSGIAHALHASNRGMKKGPRERASARAREGGRQVRLGFWFQRRAAVVLRVSLLFLLHITRGIYLFPFLEKRKKRNGQGRALCAAPGVGHARAQTHYKRKRPEKEGKESARSKSEPHRRAATDEVGRRGGRAIRAKPMRVVPKGKGVRRRAEEGARTHYTRTE